MTVYMLVFQNHTELYAKVERLCDVLSKAKFDLESAFANDEREIKIKLVQSNINTSRELLKSTRSTLRKYLAGIQKIGRADTAASKIIF